MRVLMLRYVFYSSLQMFLSAYYLLSTFFTPQRVG